MTVWILIILYLHPPGAPADIAQVVVSQPAFPDETSCQLFLTAVVNGKLVNGKPVSARCEAVQVAAAPVDCAPPDPSKVTPPLIPPHPSMDALRATINDPRTSMELKMRAADIAKELSQVQTQKVPGGTWQFILSTGQQRFLPDAKIGCPTP